MHHRRAVLLALTAALGLGAGAAGVATADGAITYPKVTPTASTAQAPAASRPRAPALVRGRAAIGGFTPKRRVVRPGGRVIFRNTDGAPHNARSLKKLRGASAFRSGAPVRGNFAIRAPRAKGAYVFICDVHPLTMRGTLVVR